MPSSETLTLAVSGLSAASPLSGLAEWWIPAKALDCGPCAEGVIPDLPLRPLPRLITRLVEPE